MNYFTIVRKYKNTTFYSIPQPKHSIESFNIKLCGELTVVEDIARLEVILNGKEIKLPQSVFYTDKTDIEVIKEYASFEIYRVLRELNNLLKFYDYVDL